MYHGDGGTEELQTMNRYTGSSKLENSCCAR